MRGTDFPLITVGIVVLNREYVIDAMLKSLMNQKYPHNKIYVVVVDGGSKDQTVKIIRKLLEESDFLGYEIIIKQCNIPEGRNIVIEKMRGDILVFWDSDVIMGPDALYELIKPIIEGKADISSAKFEYVIINSTKELENYLEKVSVEKRSDTKIVETPSVSMGQTAISKNVLKSIHFDTDLTYKEDYDFSVRARKKGFKIVIVNNVLAYDINLREEYYSDIYINMPLKDYLRGLRKKARAYVLGINFKVSIKDMIIFFLKNKRFLFYLGYIPIITLTLYGLLINNIFCILIYPAYITFYIFWQTKKRNFKQILKSTTRSMIAGLPFSLLITYYFIKYSLIKK